MKPGGGAGRERKWVKDYLDAFISATETEFSIGSWYDD